MSDCVNTIRALSKTLKIEDELRVLNMELIFDIMECHVNFETSPLLAVYIKAANVNVFLLEKYFGCKFGNMFGTHFKEKATLLKFIHRDPCVFTKSGVSHYLL